MRKEALAVFLMLCALGLATLVNVLHGVVGLSRHF